VTGNEIALGRRAKLRTLARFSHVRQSVIERIMYGRSPQQIAGLRGAGHHLTARLRVSTRDPSSLTVALSKKVAASTQSTAAKVPREEAGKAIRVLKEHSYQCYYQSAEPLENNGLLPTVNRKIDYLTVGALNAWLRKISTIVTPIRQLEMAAIVGST